MTTIAAGAPEPNRPRRQVGWLPWIIMGVVVLAALLIGTFATPTPTRAERAQALAESIRCPSCKSQSVASSDTPASQAVRALIKDRIAAGDSDEEIRDYVASRYTRSILLDPPGSGFSALVWALPVVMVIVAVGALVLRFGAWRPGSLHATDADRSLVADALDGTDPEAGTEAGPDDESDADESDDQTDGGGGPEASS